MTLSEYKKEITAIFRRNTRGGFADWRHCRRLEDELEGLLESCKNELLGTGREKELFEIACRAYVKWGDTNKDDSYGETQYFARAVCDIWDHVYEREPSDLPREKMLDWFLSSMGNTVTDYMEDVVLDYVMERFKEPEFLVRKLDFLYAKIADFAEDGSEDYMIESYKEYVLQIMGEQGRPIDFIRAYAKDMTRQSSRERLADIEQRYGNTSEAIAIYEELAAREMDQVWGRHDYNIKLKDIYRENGLQDKYQAQMERLLILETGNEKVLEEYKSLIPPEDWEKVRDRLFDSLGPEDFRALPWYAQEGCLDRLMEGVEACGYEYLKAYRKMLEGKYPERCLAILVETADRDMAEANKRWDYRHVARILRWMCKYPGGEEKAAALAAKYRAAYPRRSAMMEEIEGI